MKSIKPGRGPSMMNGLGGIFVIAFGVIWTFIAGSMSPVMGLFGIVFIGLAVVQTVYHFKNATSKDRFSTFDITDSDEETDPFNERYGRHREEETDPFNEGYSRYREEETTSYSGSYCPYCGAKIENDYRFCNKCGRELPRN